MISKYQFYFTLKIFYASPCVILILHILLNRLKDFKVNAPVFESVNEKVSSTSSCSTEVRLICFYIVLKHLISFFKFMYIRIQATCKWERERSTLPCAFFSYYWENFFQFSSILVLVVWHL